MPQTIFKVIHHRLTHSANSMGKQTKSVSKAARTRAENAECERQENDRLAKETKCEHDVFYSLSVCTDWKPS